MIRRFILAVAAASVATVATACGGHSTRTPLTIANYKGTDWVTDGKIKPPATAGRGDRIKWPHTMDGAVMAGVDSQTMLDIADDATFGGIARDYFAAGEGLSAYLAARAQITITGVPNPAKVPRIKGFRFFGYEDTAATVEVLFDQPDHSITGLTRKLVWSGETWLIELPKETAGIVKAYDTLPTDTNALPQT
ncbi:hypothetical protein ACIRRA_39905 [Nocardia sp. NPDC101769]|uniref:hypothetical protein n=1 Tax=Nocardia sp. NPDC101769 TaxID=3364333 RepID=UPI00381E8F9D